MLKTPELITALERRGVLGPGDVARVRQLHDNSPTEFVPRVLFKWLVSRGRITLDEADRILAVDPALSAAEALEQVLGRNDNLELADEDEVYDEDTKEMPENAADDVTLPPRGTAPFSDSPKTAKPPLLPTPKTPTEKKAAQPAAAAAYGDLFDELLSAGGAAAGAGPGLSALPGAAPRKKRTGWDSPLMLVGGGGLLLLVIVGSFLLWRVLRQGGDDAFAAAEESYRNAGYGAAVERYDRFLQDYPTHRSASTAVVHRGLAKLRLAVESGGDGVAALKTAHEVLVEIAPQDAFAASKGDLSALLPEISEKLAQTAISKNEEPLLEQARDARRLVDKYGAANDLNAPRLQEIDALLLTAERRLARGRRLRETVVAINQAALARNLDEAAKARTALLSEFPDAASEPTLVEATAALADVKRLAVRMIVEDRAAETAELSSPLLRKVTLAARRNPATSTAAGVVFAALEGTLFALHAADGRILWTRPVGYDSGLPAVVDPTAAGVSADGASADADVVLYDGVQKAWVRLGAQDGKLRWRQPSESGGRWTLDRERLCVTLKNRLLLYETATGKFIGQVDFPTPLGGASTADPRGKYRYQLGDAEDLYVVSNDDFQCKQVLYLGHASRSIDVPPTCVGPYVLTAENVGEQVRLRLLEVAVDGGTLTAIGERTLPGRVTSPPQVSQRIVAVVTDSGAAELFDLSGGKDRPPLEPIAKLSAVDDREVVRRHFFFRGTQLWIGGKGLTRYELQPTLGRLTPVRNLFPDRTTLQPPQSLGNLTICVAQPADFSLPRAVAAVDAEQGTVVWESFPAPTPRGPPQLSADGKTWTVVTRFGEVYDVPADGAAQVLDAPTAQFAAGLHPAEGGRPARSADGAAVYAAEAGETPTPQPLLTIEPSGKSPRTVVSPERGDWVGNPVAYRDGVLVAAASGSLQLVAPRTGAKLLEPFQPPQVVGRQPSWSRINVVGDEVLASDGFKLFRLGVETQPQPFLKARAAVDLVRPTIPEVAAIASTVYLVDGTGELTAYSLPDLRPGSTWKTRGAGYWGPLAVGERVFALAAGSTAGESQLLCLTGDGKLAWKSPVRSHCFAPIADGDSLLIADESGDVLRLDGATGRETGRVKLGIPLSAEPAIAGKTLILTTQAGELVWIAAP